MTAESVCRVSSIGNNPFRAPTETSGAITGASWRDHALCRDADAEIFFPNHAGASPRAAKEICYRCPALAHCREDALHRHEPYGIFGALTAEERRHVRNGTRRPADFDRCRNGHDMLAEGVDSGGRCRRCVAERQERERLRAWGRRRLPRCPVCLRRVGDQHGRIASHHDECQRHCPGSLQPYAITAGGAA